jgi:peptidoglycan/LPS O-acetylase OafA/YrhL
LKANKDGSKKIIGVDILRAVAALGVFYYHSHSGTRLARYTGFTFFNYTDSFGATYAVPLFFLISGYCIHASNIKYLASNSALPLKDYYLRRFLRIYPAFFVALLFAIAVNYLQQPPIHIAVLDAVAHLFLLQGFTAAYFNTINTVLWTVSIEMAFYLIYPLFYQIRFKYHLNYALGFTFLVSLISIAYFEFSYQIISLPQRFFVLNLWFAWCCGAFLADKKLLGPDDLRKNIYKILYSVIIIAFVYLNIYPDKQGELFDQFNILIWAGPVLFILSKENFLRQKQHLWIVKVVAAIGLSSYSLYLLHVPLIFVKNYLANKYLPGKFQLVAEFAGLLIIPFVAWCSYNYFEKPFLPRKRISDVRA